MKSSSTPSTKNSSPTAQKQFNDIEVPSWWKSLDDVPDLEEICSELKRDVFLADMFFFPETNNPENHSAGTFAPLFDFQMNAMQAFEDNMIVWWQASRGSAKSYTAARWALGYALRNPNQHIIVVGPSFKQSKLLWNYALDLLKHNSKVDSLLYKLEQECDIEEDVKNGHEVIITLANGSRLQALPTGQGDKIRGFRATVVIIDEAYLLTKELHDSHVLPLLNVEKGDTPPKLIYLTTSYYQETFAYSVLKDLAKHVKAGEAGYAIIDTILDELLTARSWCEGFRYPSSRQVIRHQLQSQTDPITGRLSDVALQTFYNVWIKSSARYYPFDVLSMCQDPDIPVLEKKPDNWNVPFCLGVDLAGQGANKTAMAVFSVPGAGLRYLNAVYTWEKLKPAQIAGFIHKLVDDYGMSLIVMDKTGMLGQQVADLCSEEKQLIDGQWVKRDPITVWNHQDAKKARAQIIMTLPSDDQMAIGFYGERVDSVIHGEIGLKNALHINMKTAFTNGSFRAASQVPADPSLNPGETSVKDKLLANIREALGQFPKLDRLTNSDGTLKMDDKGHWYFTRPAEDDGAYATIYGSWCADIFYRRGAKQRDNSVAIIWDQDEPQAYEVTHKIVYPVK